MNGLPKSTTGKELLAYRLIEEISKEAGEERVYELLRQYFYNKYGCIPKGFIEYCDARQSKYDII